MVRGSSSVFGEFTFFTLCGFVKAWGKGLISQILYTHHRQHLKIYEEILNVVYNVYIKYVE